MISDQIIYDDKKLYNCSHSRKFGSEEGGRGGEGRLSFVHFIYVWRGYTFCMQIQFGLFMHAKMYY